MSPRSRVQPPQGAVFPLCGAFGHSFLRVWWNWLPHNAYTIEISGSNPDSRRCLWSNPIFLTIFNEMALTKSAYFFLESCLVAFNSGSTPGGSHQVIHYTERSNFNAVCPSTVFGSGSCGAGITNDIHEATIVATITSDT